MFRGSIVAMVTPMDNRGVIDYASVDRLIDFHLDAGTDGLVIGGTTGESATLETDELVGLVSHCFRRVAGRVPVIAGSGTSSTAKTVVLSRAVQEAGAEAALVVTPYYLKTTQGGLIAHYTEVAEAVDIPLIIYNVPSRTGVDILADTVVELAAHPRIVGIKEATASVERAREIVERCGPDFVVLSGDDPTALDLFAAGARGVISVTANVAPGPMHELCAAAIAGDMARASAIDKELAELHRGLFVEPNPIPVKWALAEMGLIETGIRLPLIPLSQAHRAGLRDLLERGGLLTLAA